LTRVSRGKVSANLRGERQVLGVRENKKTPLLVWETNRGVRRNRDIVRYPGQRLDTNNKSDHLPSFHKRTVGGEDAEKSIVGDVIDFAFPPNNAPTDFSLREQVHQDGRR
jgi:hypothetical protein